MLKLLLQQSDVAQTETLPRERKQYMTSEKTKTGVHLLPDLVQHRRDRDDLLRHAPRPAGAADPASPAVGQPRHRRPARYGAWLQPPGPGRHEQAAPPQGRACLWALDCLCGLSMRIVCELFCVSGTRSTSGMYLLRPPFLEVINF